MTWYSLEKPPRRLLACLAFATAIAAVCGTTHAGGEGQDGARSKNAAGQRVPLLSDAEAWSALPKAEFGADQPLPTWARSLARTLPRTTAAMLTLDRLHRTKSPLGPALRGKMRWVAAKTNRCEYAQSCAKADLRRAGVSETEISVLAENRERLPEPERSALEFAEKMTRAADTVTDDEVAYLKSAFGDEKLAAMVLLLAYANFQDRLLLTLGVPTEAEGPLPPVEVRFARDAQTPPVPARVAPDPRKAPAVPERIEDPEWLAVKYEGLQAGLENQKARPGRIRVPTYEEVLERLPDGYPTPKHPIRIKWSLVCMGYQPELAAAWSACTRAFGQEANQDRVFEESLFWVVTRTIHCFY